MIQIFSPRQTFIATCLGGPLAGTYMLFRNERNLSRKTTAVAIVAVGLVVSLIAIPIVAFYLPDDFPPMIVPMSYGALAAGVAWQNRRCQDGVRAQERQTVGLSVDLQSGAMPVAAFAVVGWVVGGADSDHAAAVVVVVAESDSVDLFELLERLEAAGTGCPASTDDCLATAVDSAIVGHSEQAAETERFEQSVDSHFVAQLECLNAADAQFVGQIAVQDADQAAAQSDADLGSQFVADILAAVQLEQGRQGAV